MLRRLTNYAVPSIAQQSFVSVGNVVIQYYINLCGATVIAGFSAANRVNQFALTCCMSFASGLSSYVAQNIGARKLDPHRSGSQMGCGVFTRPVRGVYGDLSAVCEQDYQLFVPAGVPPALLMSHEAICSRSYRSIWSYAPSSCATACCAVPVQCVRSW